MKPGREVIEVNFGELTALLERARQEPLGDADCQRLQGAIQALNYLIEMIGEKDTTISRLRALLAKPSTEKTRKVLEKAGVGAHSPRQFLAASRCDDQWAEAETGARPQRCGGVSRGGAGQNRAPFFEVRRSLSPLFKGQGLRTEGAGPAHPGGGSGAPGGHRL